MKVFIPRISAAVLTGVLACLVGISAPASAQSAIPESTEPQFSPQQLVETVWQFVDQQYFDPRFQGQNWTAVRQQYLSQPYASLPSAYRGIASMLERLGDPATRLLTPEDYRALRVTPGHTGIGIQFIETANRQITVISPQQGSPAAIAGLLPQDVLTAIDGQPIANVFQTAGRLQGVPGSIVKLGVRRNGRALTIAVTRQKMQPAPVRTQLQTVAGQKIGFIQLVQLSGQSVTDVQAAIQSFEQQGVKGYVLDLRSLPGGSFDAAIAIAQLWLKGGDIVSIVRRQGPSETEPATDQPLSNRPLVVLVNQGTANTAEILAAALQERGRAKLVGSRTFGSSHIQSLRRFPDGSAVSMTIARWLTPAGKDIHGQGLQPDVPLALTPDQQSSLFQDHRRHGTAADPQFIKATQLLTAQ